MSLVVNILSWYAALAILASFSLVSYKIIEPVSFWYQFLNFSGGVSFTIVYIKQKIVAGAFLNAIFALVALSVLIKIILS